MLFYCVRDIIYSVADIRNAMVCSFLSKFQQSNMYSMHQGEISRLWRGFANSTSGEQAPRPPSCECEVDSMSKLIEPRLIKLHNYDARCCIIIMERYRSGHNGADSKSVCAQAHEGSNPSLSAKKKNHPIGWFFLFLNGGERGVRTQ